MKNFFFNKDPPIEQGLGQKLELFKQFCYVPGKPHTEITCRSSNG